MAVNFVLREEVLVEVCTPVVLCSEDDGWEIGRYGEQLAVLLLAVCEGASLTLVVVSGDVEAVGVSTPCPRSPLSLSACLMPGATSIQVHIMKVFFLKKCKILQRRRGRRRGEGGGGSKRHLI